MGKVIKPVCHNCGYKFQELYIGGGMINSRTVDNQPVYNKETETVETANVKQREKVLAENENLTFYDSEEMFRIHPEYTKKIPGFVEQMENYKLYFCPKCQKKY